MDAMAPAEHSHQEEASRDDGSAHAPGGGASAAPELTVLILARNEAASLRLLLPELVDVLRSLPAAGEIVLVDGNSEDETVAVAHRFGARVVVQKEPGYGAAFREGIDQARGVSIVTIDADGSHAPSSVRLLHDRRNDADVLIGSRYCAGGAHRGSWFRFLLSRLLNAAFRWFLWLRIKDVSSGLRLYRAAALRDVTLAAKDFDILEEALVRLLAGGSTVIELPIEFRPRARGVSKARLLRLARGYMTTLWRLRRLRFGRNPRDAQLR
jgi:dolichol-phosphate mannosyltransferase